MTSKAGLAKDKAERARGVENAASRKVLLQLATRALRRVHFDAQLLSLSEDDGSVAAVRRLNQAPGLEMAPELTIRDALAQEFYASKLTHGWKLRANKKPRDTDPDARYFAVIDREVAYRTKKDGCSLHIDLEYRRIPGPGQTEGRFLPVGPVELKRAQNFSIDKKTGELVPGRLQTREVTKDVRKLARFVRAERAGMLKEPFESTAREDDRGDMLHPQVLIWGRGRRPGPGSFLREVFSDAKRCGCGLLGKPAIEWMPVQWDSTPRVQTWLWIAVATLAVDDNPCGNRHCPCRAPTRMRRRRQKSRATLARPSRG